MCRFNETQPMVRKACYVTDDDTRRPSVLLRCTYSKCTFSLHFLDFCNYKYLHFGLRIWQLFLMLDDARASWCICSMRKKRYLYCILPITLN